MKVQKDYTTLFALLLFGALFTQLGRAQTLAITNVAGDGTDGEETYVDESDALSTPIPRPTALAADADGNIYFACVGFGKPSVSGVYKIDQETNIIHHVLSNVEGTAGMTIDKETNILYFSRGSNFPGDIVTQEYIYSKNLTTGELDTIAGNGLNGEPVNGAIARETFIGNAAALKIGPDGDYLYYSARYLSPPPTLGAQNFIQRINLETNITERVVGLGGGDDVTNAPDETDALGADIAMSYDFEWDNNNNLYFVALDNMIKKVIDGKIYNVVGSGSAGDSGDGGPAGEAEISISSSGLYINEENELIFSDTQNNTIRKIILSGDASADGIITRYAGTGFEEGEDNPDGDLFNEDYKLPLNANIYPFDLMYLDGELFLTDNIYRVRKIVNCFAPEVSEVTKGEADICKGDEVTLTVDGELNEAAEWSWYRDECSEENLIDGENNTSLTVTVEEDMTYFIRGTGGCGVFFDDCYQVDIELDCKDYYNTFTPNGDGVNDYFEIPVLENYPENTVRIFNRWGDLLELIENYDNSTQVWLGTNGESDPVDPGTYYFTAEADGQLIASGWVQLIK